MGAWALWLNHANEVLITISTLLAIAVGLWTLYDKWRGEKKVDPVEEKLDVIINKVEKLPDEIGTQDTDSGEERL